MPTSTKARSMFLPTRRDKPRDLYQTFRDGILEDCARFNLTEVELWKMVPKENIGRLQTMAGLRKLANRFQKEFPGAITWRAGRLGISIELIEFAKTHRELGSTEQEAIEAWRAMQTL